MSRKTRKKARKKRVVDQRRTQQKKLSIQPPSGTNVTKISKKISGRVFILLGIPMLAGVVAFVVYFLSHSHRQILRNSELNVLLVTLDTTRADRIGSYGYEKGETPNLDYLAANGVRFANAYCQVPLTLPSHCSLMTGTYPIFHLVRDNGFYYLESDYVTLAEVLKDKGFKTAAFVSSFTVDSRFGIDQGFDVYDDKILENQVMKNFASEREADEAFNAFSGWMGKNFNQKFFCWLHFFDPHSPYDPPSPFKEKYSERLYDGEIAYMDSCVGKTIDLLREKNLLDSTLIILAGDHGEALGEKNEQDHGLYVYDVTMRIPLIFHLPNSLPQGLVIEPRVRLIDIMPTICDILNIPPGDVVQGTSLLPFIKKRKKEDLPSYIETYMPREYYGWSELIGLIDGDWKYIHAPKPELYNIKSDPIEENNVFRQESDVVSSMRERLNVIIENYSLRRKARKKRLTREEKERLRSLGYVANEYEDNTSKQALADPKDKIDEYALFTQAKKFELKKDYESAEKSYRELLCMNPDSPWFYVYLALLYEKMEKLDNAIRLMEEARKRFPDSAVILSRLSLFNLKKKKLDEAFDTSQAVLRIDPKHFEALYISADALGAMNKWKDALTFIRRALEIEPENKSLGIKYALCLSALNRKNDALEVYLRLREEYPDDPIIYRDIGIMYDAFGELEKARDNFKRALELDPSPNAFLNYAIVLEKCDQLEDAVYYLRLYLETTKEGNTEEKKRANRILAQWEARLQRL